MLTQTLHNPLMISSLVVASPSNYLTEQPVRACSSDYGFDFDEDELAALAARPSAQPVPQVTADEFESRYHWFIS